MKNKKNIIISGAAVVLLILIYLFLLPNLINLNSYKPQIEENIKTATGLDLSFDNIELKTNLNLSVEILADKIKLNYSDGKKLLSLDDASANISLIPLLFKNIEITKIKLNHPEINLYREKNGCYSIESLFKNTKTSDEKQAFKLVNGINIEVKNYVLKLDDYYYQNPKNFVLAGDLIKIIDFNPNKYINLETKGKFFIEGKQNIKFDIKFKSELPFKSNDNSATQHQSIDPLKAIVNYNFKSDITADIRLKNVQKSMGIDGFVNFEGLTLKIKDKILPESYGKLNFKENKFDIDSKLFITPASYIYLKGNVKDLNKNQFNLDVKTSEVDLAELKLFAESINDISANSLKILDDFDISGKLTADFNIAENSNFIGYLNIINTNIFYKGLSKPIKNLTSTIKFEGEKLVLNNTAAFIDNNKINFNGFIDSDNNIDLKINVNAFTINTILDLVNNSLILKGIKTQFKEVKSLSGAVKIEAAAKGNLCKKISPEIKISMINPAVVLKRISVPVSFSKGSIFLNDKNLQLNGLQANVLSSPVLISGNITDYSEKEPESKIFVKIPSFNVANLKKLSNSNILDKNSIKLINSIKNLSGTVSANINILPEQNINAVISANNVYAYYVPSALPIRIISGSIISDGKKIELNKMSLKVSDSTLNLYGNVTSLAKLPVLDLNASGYVTKSDIKKYSSSDLRKSIAVKGNIPVTASVSGYVDGWKLNSQAKIDNLSYIADINTSGSKILKINLNGNPSTVSFFDSGISSSAGQLISVTGGINRYNSKNPVLNNVKVSLLNLNLSTVEPKGKLQLNGNISISGNLCTPKATGNISVKNISVPSMYLTSDNINIALKSNDIVVNTGMINVQDSKFKISTTLQNNLTLPFVVKDLNISSSYMNADKLQKAFPPVPNQDMPVVVKKGRFLAAKMLLNGLQVANTTCNFVINPMNIMKITNLTASAAGGTANGKINMNLKNSRISVNINTNNMQINALASAFANMPNEIFGDMNGNINLTTSGYTPEETSNNAVGNINFTVVNGKLSRLGSITNMLQGGFGSQLISNIISYKEINSSNQFKKLTGEISLNNGIMNINELTTQGGDMSLYTRGSIRISNNYADLTTLGTLSERITSKLGRIPDFSVDKLVENKLLKKIPGQWGQIISDFRPKTEYPDLNKIPSLSRGNSDTDRHFIVKIKGDFYKPTSVKSFKVIN